MSDNKMIPNNLEKYYEPLPDKVEKEYKEIHDMVEFYFKSKNYLDYSFLIIKCMESVEDLKEISKEHKKIIVVRCVADVIVHSKNIKEKLKPKLLESIPYAVETIISVTKKHKIGNGESSDINDRQYIIFSTLDKIRYLIRKQDYSVHNVLKNLCMISLEAMNIVETYSTLSGPEKKQYVIDIIFKLLGKLHKSINHPDEDDDENDHLKLDDEDENFIFNDEQFEEYKEILSFILPPMIDNVSNASKNKFNINKIDTVVEVLHEGAKGNWFCCL
jgi:hypothetical protein